MLPIDLPDICEIVIITIFIFGLFAWLAQDKKILYLVYSYFLTILLCLSLNLTTVSTLLILISPITSIIFLIIHQKMLQKNFVRLTRVQSEKNKLNNQWIEELIQCALIEIHNNKETTYIIECQHSIASIIKKPAILNADFTKDLFTILSAKHTHSANYFIWITDTGKLIAINAHWNYPRDQELTDHLTYLDQWQQDALIISNQFDTLIFKSNPLSRKFDFVVQGKIFESLNSYQLYNLLMHYVINQQKPNSSRDSIVYAQKSKTIEYEQDNI